MRNTNSCTLGSSISGNIDDTRFRLELLGSITSYLFIVINSKNEAHASKFVNFKASLSFSVNKIRIMVSESFSIPVMEARGRSA